MNTNNLVTQADQICYAVLCVFSYVAAGPEKRGVRPPLSLTKPSASHLTREARSSEQESPQTLRLPSPSPQVQLGAFNTNL